MRHLARVHILFIPLLLLASCGQQQKAKSLVKDFVSENARQEIDISSFSDLDSTRVITDSLIISLRQRAPQDPLFKATPLAPFSGSGQRRQTLLYIRMRYQEPGDTIEASRTFYFDRDLTGIIAFK